MCANESRCHGNDNCCCPSPTSRLKKPAVLMLLSEQSLHGYAIIEELQELGIEGAEPGGVYRLLRNLEDEDLVESEWETEGKGPAKRTYCLTAAGEDRLLAWRGPLTRTADLVEEIMSRIETGNQ